MANILIVDDSMLERKILNDMVTTLGHSVVGEAKNGEQAIEEYMQLKPDLVTMDLTMRGMSGAEATSGIIAEDPEARIVVVSSHQERQVILNALERGARHYIIKPLSLGKVSAVLTSVLQQPFDRDRHHDLIGHLKNSVCDQQKSSHRTPARILIVDDSAFSRQMLRDVATALGHKVVGEATNGMQAFIEYNRLKPDLVTMDLTMPGLGGAEAISRIIAAHPEARIIVISAVEARTCVIDALERGARHFVVKPIRQEKIAAAIENILQQQFVDPQKNYDVIQKLKASADTRALVAAAPEPPPPYAISPKNNFVHVFINESLTLISFQTLMNELAEYLEDKPRLLLDFGAMSKLDQPLFCQLNKLVQTITDNAGFVQAIANSKEFVASVTSAEPDKNANLLAKVLTHTEL